MNQEENTENLNSEDAAEDAAENASNQTDALEIDNLPIESIGSYARLEELLDDETKENTTNTTSQS
jgi:hypothetical protein